MSPRGALRSLAAGLAILLVAAPSAQAQAEPDPEWKVLTVSQSGAWGLSTARSQGEAIASAVRQCQLRSADDGDCGAELLACRNAWAVAILCGEYRVLLSAGDLEQAETAAAERIAALKRSHEPVLPPCRRLLTIDPVGRITTEHEPTRSRLPVAEKSRLLVE